MKQIEDAIDEKQMARIEAMILSMTPKERANPDHAESVPQAAELQMAPAWTSAR